MIIWNASTRRFEIQGRPGFDWETRESVQQYQQDISGNGCLISTHSSPLDRFVSTQPISQRRVPSGTNLCHHISIDSIQRIVCDYLNGDVSFWQFINFVGNVTVPTWLSLMTVRSCPMVLRQWMEGFQRKFALAYHAHGARRGRREVARLASDFCAYLNNCHVNLRYGDGTTNMSVGAHLDPRLARGITIEPVALLEHVFAYVLGRPVMSSESSAFLNGGYDALLRSGGGLAIRAPGGGYGGGIAMSESDLPISLTRSGTVVRGEARSYASRLRGNIPLLTYSPCDRSLLANLFGLVLFIWFAMKWLA